MSVPMKVKRIGMAHVKATKMLDLEKATITERGIAGDRNFILLDKNGAPLPAGRHRHFLPLRFDYDAFSNLLKLTYPDGRYVEEECVTNLVSFGLNYMNMRSIQVRKVEGEWARRLSAFGGAPVRIVRVVNTGDGVDVLPITLFTTASLRNLSLRMGTEVDYRRFRANLIIECDEPYAEDRWNGRRLQIGSCLLRVRSSVPRCVVTQLDPDTGINNVRTIPMLVQYREKVRLPDGLMPHYETPGFASYAEVIQPGEVAVGDMVMCE